MKNNFFVSYDLMKQGQNYEAIEDAIKSLGDWARVTQSFFYVSTSFSLKEAFDRVNKSIDRNDKLMIIDAKSAHWIHLPEEVSTYIKENWSR